MSDTTNLPKFEVIDGDKTLARTPEEISKFLLDQRRNELTGQESIFANFRLGIVESSTEDPK